MATITRTSDAEREALRRSASATSQGPTAEQQANSFPRHQLLDNLGEINELERPTFPFLRLMRRDHMVAMGLHFIDMPIVRAPWYMEADDARAAAFADNLIRPIYGGLVLTLLRMLSYGYSPAAKNFELIQPTWRYLPGLGQDPQPVWDQGNIDALVYKPVTPLRPETAKPVWDAQGNFNGIRYDKRYGSTGYFVINGQSVPDIDRLHSVWAVHDQPGEDGSPWGYPRIAHCAPIFHMYRYIWTLLGRAFENNADPGPVVRYPRNDLPQRSASGRSESNVEIALRIGKRRRSGSTVALPSDPYTDLQDKPTGKYKWDIEYPKSETSFQEILNFIGFLESAKLRALWLQEQGIIEGSGASSNRNVAAEFGQQRDDSQLVLVTQIFDLITECFVKPAMAMNMPMYQGTITMKPIGFSSDEDEIARQIIQLAGQTKDFSQFGVDMRRLLDSRGMPMLSPDDYKKVQDEAAAQAAAAPTPAVTPTQGRRALVTQTGFDRETGTAEMSYVQLEGRIELASSDGDFVASLPKTDVFANKQVLAATRALRTDSVSFLTWIYGDFARFMGKQRSLDLQEMLADEELASNEDPVRAVVDRVLGSWKPKISRITDFSTRLRNALGKVYDRTAGIHLDRLGSRSRTSSLDREAATWLDAHGAESVQSILDTTRQQLAGVLAEGVREGKSTKDIAAGIREHFSEFPQWRAAAIARTETSAAYNFATVRAGMAAGVARAQLMDGNKDEPCKSRNGRIVALADALKEKLAHTNCTLFIRLLPKASANLEVRHEPLEGYSARYDEQTETVLLDPGLSMEAESEYLIALGDMLAQDAEPAPEEIVA